MKILKIADICCGIGGFRYATEKTIGKENVNCVFSCDIDDVNRECYLHNFKDWPKGDINDFLPSQIPKHDIMFTGFPCQTFSCAGKRTGFEEIGNGSIFFKIVKIIEHCLPKFVLLENVPNILVHDKGKTIETIRSMLYKIGYDCFINELNSSNFGSPQNRKRVFLCCPKLEMGIKGINIPIPHKKSNLIDFLLPEKVLPKELFWNRDDFVLYPKTIKKDSDGFYEQKPIRVGHVLLARQGERIYSQYGHAITFMANSGGFAGKTGAYLINNKVRKLDPLEVKRIMGYPVDFYLSEVPTKAYWQLGNSVDIRVVSHVIKEILKLF